MSELNVLNRFISYPFPGLLSILFDFHFHISTLAGLEPTVDDLPSLPVYCNDSLGLLYELAMTLSECEMLIHFLLFKSHKLGFPRGRL